MARKVMAFVVAMLALCSCNIGTTDKNALYDIGVSIELAKERSESIKNLEYSLQMCIPENKDSAVCGRIDIGFSVKCPQEIIIDFREGEESVLGVLVNERTTDYEVRNEHIIIPAEAVREGDNSICIDFIAGDQSLNRNDEFLYTLLVPDRARTVFPCFDQPDMKASFKLVLTMPETWTAVSNSPVMDQTTVDGRKRLSFRPTEPLSTYLFSFVAGVFENRTYDDGKHTFTAYYRETDEARIAQLPTIFSQVAMSLDWMEQYTGVDYPFAKYDFIMLPGFQYGGMEHTGATLYNASQMFLGDNPTLDELLRRSSVIAHETAHMWFGDYVTMRWFDDVWTKEVFANYFAARIVEPLYPTINHHLNRLKNYTIASLSEDRTTGSNAIRQQLDNLQNAGLIYGRIIYNKAPIVMDKLVEIMGDEAYRNGIREYLTTYGYDNATWPELIEILDGYTDADLRSFSEVWVHSNAMPIVECRHEGNTITLTTLDPLGRGLFWPQSFTLRAILCNKEARDIDITLTEPTQCVNLDSDIAHIIPNTCGRGYGLFTLPNEDIHWLLNNLSAIDDDLAREASLINLHELYKWGYINDTQWINTLNTTLNTEHNYLIASTICDYISEPLIALHNHDIEESLWHTTTTHPIISLRRKLLTTLAHAATSPMVTTAIYDIWSNNGAAWLGEDNNFTQLGENDAMTIAYELGIRCPEQQQQIIATQRSRITNPDRQREFDYISRGTAADIATRDALFDALLDPAERRTEPWAAALLRLLNHHTRQAEATKYIYRGLAEMEEIQRTGDIFFPSNWSKALLSGHHSPESRAIVEAFLADNPDYSPLLRSKILQSADIVMTK